MKIVKPANLNEMHATQLEDVMKSLPDFSDANAVMAAICCASAEFSAHPSLDLALVIEELVYTLNSPNYTQTPLMKCVAERLMQQWGDIVDSQESQLINNANVMHICH